MNTSVAILLRPAIEFDGAGASGPNYAVEKAEK
jgi:hypothetical protein